MRKILIIHHNSGIGGAGISLINISKMLEFCYDVQVYIPRINSKLGAYMIHNSINTNEIGDDVGIICSYSGSSRFFGRTSIRNIFKIQKSKKIIESIIEKENPDLVAVNSMTLSWIGKIIKNNNRKSICFVRETYKNNIGMGIIKHNLNKYFDCVVFISEFDKMKANCNARITGVVRNCIIEKDYEINESREEACRILKIDENKFNILFVGGTSKLKGWDIIRKAMKELTYYDIQLVVAGTTHNVNNNYECGMVFLGIQLNMPLVYKACDVLVFPSIKPHQARPVFEAGIMGLPVIISDFEETKEFVIDGVNGITFVPNDSKDLASKIYELYKNRNLTSFLGKNNKKYAVENHEFQKCKESLLRIIDSI